MAVTHTTGTVAITETATQIVGANANRQSLAIRVQLGEIWIGSDNTVTSDDGWWWRKEDGPFDDSVCSTSAWYAICRSGHTAKVNYIELSG